MNRSPWLALGALALSCGKSLPEEPVPRAIQSLEQATFTELVIDTTLDDPWGKGAGDVDGDGDVDLLAQANVSGGLVWYEAPSWTRRVISSDAGFSTDLEVGDVDGNGFADVVSVHSGGLRLYAQGPAGTWTQSPISTRDLHDVELAAGFVAARDQAAFSSPDNGGFVYFYALGTWTEASVAVPEGEGLIVADLDADGDLDVAVNQVWLENTAAGWVSHVYTSIWTHPHAFIATGDVNGDGRVDLIASPAELTGGSHRLSWFESPADRSQEWTEHIIKDPVATAIHFVGAADFNGDGALDVAFAEMSQSIGDRVSVLHQDGSTWTQQVLSTAGSHSMRIVDLGTGRPSLFGANWRANGHDENVKLWVNDGTPKLALDLWRRHTIDASKPARSLWIAARDVDGDGDLDVLTGAHWYESTGSVGGTWIRHDLGGTLRNVVAVLDRDGDGDLDVLASQGNGSESNGAFSFGRNDGAGAFTEFAAATGSGDFLQGLALIGNTALLSWHQPGLHVQALEIPLDPGGAWQISSASTTSEDEALSATDLDGDGDPDVFQGSGWLRNDGAGVWTRITVASLAGDPDRNVLVDVDGDGDIDAVVGFDQDPSDLIWLENSGSPESPWAVHTIATDLGGGYSLDVADLDGDGDPDVVLGEHKGLTRLLVFENNGTGTSWTQIVADSGGSGIDQHVGTQLADLDDDGDLDIVSVGWDNPAGVWAFENLAIDEGAGGTGGAGGASGCPPRTGLVAHWALDDGTGSVAADRSGNGHDGAVTGASWSTGQIGGALDFAGSDHVDAGALNAGPGITVAAWVYPEGWSGASRDNRIVVKSTTGSAANDHVWMLSGIACGSNTCLRGRLKVDGKASTLISSTPLQLDTWQHVAMTYDDATIKLWIAGVQVASAARSGSVSSTGDNARIGRHPSNQYGWIGLIDEVLLYDTAQDVSTLLSYPEDCGGGGAGGEGGTGGAPNEPPTAAFETALASVVFDGSLSFDNDGSITSWAWDCGNATNDSGVEATCNYDAPGSYLVTLTVTDTVGVEASVQHAAGLP